MTATTGGAKGSDRVYLSDALVLRPSKCNMRCAACFRHQRSAQSAELRLRAVLHVHQLYQYTSDAPSLVQASLQAQAVQGDQLCLTG
jgi:hypothetical protein